MCMHYEMFYIKKCYVTIHTPQATLLAFLNVWCSSPGIADALLSFKKVTVEI